MCVGLYEVRVVIILSGFPRREEKIFAPNSNNSFLKVLELVVGSTLIFLQASGCIFIASFIRYDTFVAKPEGIVKRQLI